MRTAARTALATAVLAGALLAPAGAAFAATGSAAAAASSSGAASPSVPDRYAGTPVSIDKGIVAVLRYRSEGPEAWIRAVSPDWKPGDTYTGDVLLTLDDEHRTGSVEGLQLKLVEGEEIHVQSLVVTKNGKTSSYELPHGQGSECGSEPVSQPIGAGALARLMMTPNGPVAQLEFAEEGPDAEHTSLTRAVPSLPEGAGIIARILNPSSAEPVFEWKTQGGDMPYGHAAFPKLPKGCTFDYTFQKPTQKPQPDPKPSAKPSTKPSVAPVAPRPQTGGQTTVVPKGPVAAGAEITADDDNSITTAAGAGLVAILLALGTTFMVRARKARSRG
ncbi:hypothetical protein ABZY44_10150 [Streptomyces sp. NPDC006544]|uniref:hypothetical protein n=1 Tax=Streptomyces sp. NPDC006544 TaxID=3154583 RepID=UPI0033AD9320